MAFAQVNPYNPFQNPFGVAQKSRADIPAGWDGVVQLGQKNNPTVTPVGPYAHGNGGIFAVSGQQPQVFSAMLLPQAGFIDDLPILYSGLGQEYDGGDQAGFGGMSAPLHTYITGVTKGAIETVTNQPTQPCDPGPEGGLVKACTVTMPFGKYRASLSMNLEQIATLRDRADPTYLQLMNMAPGQTNLVPSMINSAGNSGMLISEFTKRCFTLATSWKRFLASRTWIGNPTNSAASNNWKDIVGMDLQINTGNKVDVFTSNVCTALNSDIKDFGSRLVSSNGAVFYTHIDMLWFYLNWNARRQGLGNCEWTLVMRPELFDEVVKIWPVEQYTEALTAIGAFANGRVNIDGSATIQLRDAMRQGSYLPIRGVPVRVIQDDTVTELDVTNNAKLAAGQYSSDIYFVPRTVLGGMPITYIQPFRQDAGLVEQVVAEGRLTRTFTTDGGLFRWYIYEKGPCLQWDIMTMFRVRTHMPQLAGRLQNVAYAPLQHVRSWNPDSQYFFNGGRTNAPQTSYYTEWSTGTPVVIS